MAGDRSKSRDKGSDGGRKKGGSPAGSRGDRPSVGKKKDGPRKGGSPKGSREYSPKQLKDRGRSNWDKERRKHTSNAERKARREIKAATGKDRKIAGKNVEHHHHAGVRESKRAGLNPKVAGEPDRMTAVHSRRDKKVYGTVGDNANPAKNKRYTHHNVASKIDKAEQARTAKKMGAKGDSPKLPRGDKGRKGLTDASATSKWRFPATGDQAERAKMKWERKEPPGPKVDSTGRVIRESKPPAKLDAPKPPAKLDAPKQVPKVDAPSPPKVKAPGFGGSKLENFAKGLGKAEKALGVIGNVAGSVGEAAEIIAREKPEWLPEGIKVPLTKPVKGLEFMYKPSGYTVEKTDGQVIYRGPDGKPVSRDEALRNSSLNNFEEA
jgi:hypothetical protein